MTKKTKGAKTAKAGRIPKQVGGVKLPKGLRKSGEKLIEKAATPEGRRVIAAGLAMASAAVARARVPAEPFNGPTPPVPPIPPIPPVPPHSAQSGEGAAPPAPATGTTTTVDPAQIAEAVGQAATAFFDGLFGRKR